MSAAIRFKDLAEILFLGPGFNWLKTQGMIAVGIGGYDSPLPPGTRVLMETFDPGTACMEGPLLIARGRLRGVDADGATIDFAGWLLYCHETLPGDYAYQVF